MNQLNVLDPENTAARRLLFGLLGILVLALNNKLGLGLTTETQAMIVGAAVTIVLGSKAKEVALAKADAAAKAGAVPVETMQAALDVMNGKGPQP